MTEVNLFRQRLIKGWCICLLATLALITICIRWLDIPIALHFRDNSGHLAKLGTALGSSTLVAGEMIIILGVAIIRISRGRLPEFAKALFIACSASLSAFVANDNILKLIFGRQSPSMLFHGAPSHVFNFFNGDEHSSFPSGHMVMATAFAVAMIRLQPRTRFMFMFLLCVSAAVLIGGNWHFVGDVVAGAFVGGTAGLLAAELWIEHDRGPSLIGYNKLTSQVTRPGLGRGKAR